MLARQEHERKTAQLARQRELKLLATARETADPRYTADAAGHWLRARGIPHECVDRPNLPCPACLAAEAREAQRAAAGPRRRNFRVRLGSHVVEVNLQLAL